MSTEKTTNPEIIPPTLLEMLQAALTHQKEGRIKEAEEQYKKALSDFPFLPDVHYMAALFFVQNGKRKYGLTLLNKLLQSAPDNVKVLRLIGQIYYEDGEGSKALQPLRRAHTVAPNDAEINRLLGLALYRDTQISEAKTRLKQSLDSQPNIEAYNKLSEIYLIEENFNEARALLEHAYAKRLYNYDTLLRLATAYGLGSTECTKTALRAISLNPLRDEAKTILAQSVVLGGTPQEISPAMSDIVMLCLKSSRVNHNEIITLWERQIFKDPQNIKAATLLNQSDYPSFCVAYDDVDVRRALLKPLFIEGVKNIMVVSLEQENLLTHLRHYYLDLLTHNQRSLSHEEEDLLGALAVQCFYNEYVLDVSAEEEQQLKSLKASLESQPITQITPRKIAIFACYEPLTALHHYQDLAQAQMPAFLRDAIHVGVQEVLEQRRLQSSIKSLCKITDETSRKVQEQYEENPYPRWKSHSYIEPLADKSFDPAYRREIKILIAGCGTGKHILHTSASTPSARITAVDLSRSSLAYAMMRIKEYSIPNVNFIHCDILDLDVLGNDFDTVESIGVLHHMRDPIKGLEVLLRRLKPSGRIRLGLYSEMARQDIVRMRDIIAQRNFSSTTEGIRACRQYIKDTDDTTFQSLKISKDFYTISSVRDMLFHVQESRFTLPQIQQILDSHGLVFEKFNLPRMKLDIYRKHYPDDPQVKNLLNMDAFEKKYPGLFAGMYQFSAIKK
ncbi:MAG: methyltransferase domain-containing protein [Alphaproteobacteria bacterium]|nr:methyltransferase domain-containing protein [Alphaproteobacteria bacterium]